MNKAYVQRKIFHGLNIKYKQSDCLDIYYQKVSSFTRQTTIKEFLYLFCLRYAIVVSQFLSQENSKCVHPKIKLIETRIRRFLDTPQIITFQSRKLYFIHNAHIIITPTDFYKLEGRISKSAQRGLQICKRPLLMKIVQYYLFITHCKIYVYTHGRIAKPKIAPKKLKCRIFPLYSFHNKI